MTDSIFTKIIKREIPAEIIYEDEHTLVIPDKFPSMPGQLVVISKRQVDYIFKLPTEEYLALMTTTKKVSLALDQALDTLRTCIMIEGFEVPHIHVRLYPCTSPELIQEPRKEASAEELKILATKVREKLLLIK
jgi:histidine triad (HIT) family protein